MIIKTIKLPLNIINLLFDSPASSISAERSFSLLGKVLQDDIPFDINNVKFYIILLYNKIEIIGIKPDSESEYVFIDSLYITLDYLLDN